MSRFLLVEITEHATELDEAKAVELEERQIEGLNNLIEAFEERDGLLPWTTEFGIYPSLAATRAIEKAMTP